MSQRLPRRHLLALTACAPVAAVAAARGQPAPPAVPVAAETKPAPDGPATYRETEHARRYYRSAARL